jgi:uncharacterized protein (TIGR04222 family)
MGPPLTPLDWAGRPFLELYAIVAGLALLLLWALRFRMGRADGGDDGDGLDVLHVAYLAGGPDRALDTAMVGLFEAGAAMFDRRSGQAVIDRGTAVDPVFAPFRHVEDGKAGRQAFHAQYASRVGRIRSELGQRGLIPTAQDMARFRLIAGLGLCGPVGLGLAKLGIGLSRGRPVGYLIIALTGTVVLGLCMAWTPPSRNRAGQAVLDRWRRDNARAARAPLPEEVPLAFALTGTAVLAGMAYRRFFHQGGGADSGSSGDSSGSSGCGGCNS